VLARAYWEEKRKGVLETLTQGKARKELYTGKEKNVSQQLPSKKGSRR